MNCPKCQTKVAEGHFYCPNCRTMIHSNIEEEAGANRGMVERAGSVLFNLLLIGFIIAGSVVVARQINWQELIDQFKGKPEGRVKVERPETRARAIFIASRSTDQVVEAASSTEMKKSERSSGPTGIESVRALSQKIEELPTLEEAAKSTVAQPAQSLPARIEPAKNSDPSSTAPVAPDKPVQTPRSNPALSAEQIDAKQSGDAGFVTITSYVAARIYVDGQFSGVTPRTVKLTSGDHQIRLIADGFEDWTRRVRLKSKQQVGLMASMKKKPGP